jgi:hypothetical protein
MKMECLSDSDNMECLSDSDNTVSDQELDSNLLQESGSDSSISDVNHLTRVINEHCSLE